MQSIEQLTKVYPHKVTVAVVKSINWYDQQNDENGIRSIVYDVQRDCIFVCFETSGDIVQFDLSGEFKLYRKGEE
jgi:precorrin-4 methylase